MKSNRIDFSDTHYDLTNYNDINLAEGSDINAALYYIGKLINSATIDFITRRWLYSQVKI